MVTIMVALGAFLIGSGCTALTARYFFRMGWEMAHDDRRLEPGAVVGTLPSAPSPTAEETTGPIPVVGQSSGKHAMPAWPDSDDGPAADTAVVPAVEVKA